jgi:rare lipoprotein A (peptidoglycan hydrolase)
MNRGCKRFVCMAFVASGLVAGLSPAAAQDFSRLFNTLHSPLEKPWALGVKPQSGWRLEVVKPNAAPALMAVLNRTWPATVHLAKPKAPIVTGALTPVSYTPYSPPETTGIASFYWQDQMTSSGERFDKTAMTAAHKTLPMHTRVRVTRLDTGRSVIVRINDRGPFKPGRIIDLSDAAAEALGMRMMGLAQVKIDVMR